MAEKVTLQDVADALGLSRNTVSKAINNTGVLAETTRKRVLEKARAMGYKQYTNLGLLQEESKSSEEYQVSGPQQNIVMLTGKVPDNMHFASTMMDRFQMEIGQFGYSFSLITVLPAEIRAKKLPGVLDKRNVAGLVCVEIFDAPYCKMLVDTGIPVVFEDWPVFSPEHFYQADRVIMDNRNPIFQFMSLMRSRNKTKGGFIGDPYHCESFFQRWRALREGAELCGFLDPAQYSVLGKDPARREVGFDYAAYIQEELEKLEELPDFFLCANDFVATTLFHVLNIMGRSVPSDILVCGFDDAPGAKFVTPSLTTIHIHTQEMGVSAANLLLARIKNPDRYCRTIITETELILRESTGD